MSMGAVPDHPDERLEDLYQAFCEAWLNGENPDPETFCRKCPAGGDALRSRIEDFISVTRCLKGAPDRSPGSRFRPSESEEKVKGKRLGDFRILREIGRGGMGVVYEAEQVSLERRVAVKVLPAHLTLREASVARFRREASTAARLRHPGIVEIHSVGEQEGTHYFAMEFVRGAPLDQVIKTLAKEEARPLSGARMSEAVAGNLHRVMGEEVLDKGEDGPVRERSRIWRKTYIETICRIVAQVADALEYAHAAGVVHRDVKPSNILLCEDGRAVLTDFGLAREEGLPSVSVTGEFAGTPHYVSPEQAMSRRRKVDHRTDVFSLGVTLYELLSLKKPFDGKTSQEVLGKILNKEPPLLRGRNQQIPRDLETVCLAAMEKDPARRYQSAGEFRDDLQRFLEFRPVRARTIGFPERALRLVRRNPAYAAVCALLFLLVVVGPVFFGFQQKLANIRIREALERVAEERDQKEKALGEKEAALLRADEEAEAARQVSDFLEALFKVPDPSEARGRTITAFEILKYGAEEARIRLADQPEILARLMETLGSVYLSLGLYSEGGPLLEQSLETHIRLRGDEHPSTLRAMHRVAKLYLLQGRYATAETLLKKAQEACRKVFGLEHADTLAVMNDTALLYKLVNRYGDAEGLYEETLQIRKRILGMDHPDTFESMYNLAFLHMHQGRYEESERLFLQSLEGRRRVLGAQHPDTLTSSCDLAVLYARQGRFEEAEPRFLEALEMREALLGPDHPDTITSVFKLAMFYLDQGRTRKAEPLFRGALKSRQGVLGEEHPKTLIVLTYLAILCQEEGRVEEAEPLYRQALEAQHRVLGACHNFTLFTSYNLACLYHEQGRDREAEPLAREAVERTAEEHPEYGERKALLEEILKVIEGSAAGGIRD